MIKEESSACELPVGPPVNSVVEISRCAVIQT
jgi:hypothetical protein